MTIEPSSGIRVTVATAQVLRAFLSEASRPRYGYDLMQETGFASGKLYPILARLTRAGWLDRKREDIDPAVEGRPARYLYCLTGLGAASAREELAALAEQFASPASPWLRPLPGGGTA
jgi:PadR family transcriptional regulator, regulatory protein PadR